MQNTIEIKNKNLRLHKRFMHNIVIYGSICIIIFSFIVAFSDFVINENIKSFLFFFAIIMAWFAIKYHESTYYVIDFYSDSKAIKLKILKFNSVLLVNTSIDKLKYKIIYSNNKKNEIKEVILQLNNNSYKISNSNYWNNQEIELLLEYFKSYKLIE